MAGRVAVITDIHGNLPALQAALARIAERAIPTSYGNYDPRDRARSARLRLRVRHAA
jgi:hypothetical protein